MQKTTVTIDRDNTKQRNEYPMYMESDNGDHIVYFEKWGTGVPLVTSSQNCQVGESWAGWDMDYFTPIRGTITIKCK